jgi:hypothetical protein
MNRSMSALSLMLALTACNHEAAGGKQESQAAPAVQQVMLAKDPGAALSVNEAKAGGAKDHVVVQGRIAKIVKGHAVFQLMDLSLPYCGEKNTEDKCDKPWDYCCETPEARTANSLLVEVRSADGTPVATPALPDLRLVDAVKVTGQLTVDEHGNHVLVATGLFRTQRPTLPAYVKWPE